MLFALTASLTLGVTACKDDEDNNENKPNEETSEEQADQDMADAAQFWDVVGQLTDEPMPDEGWLQTTYAPSVGEPDGGNTAVRIVQCEDGEAAAECFADLVGLTMGSGFNADTQEYSFRLLPDRQDGAGVGTLTYRRTGGEALATVDVDIPQMPGLQQIIYRQHVENGSFDGTAYYRFGDIVTKKNADGETDYWICVRPAFGLAEKSDSHWMTVSKLPSENVKTVNKTVKGMKLTHLMPKNLCANQEHMQNLAELLYAMLFPAKWAENLETANGYLTLKYFKNLNYKKVYPYNNRFFFEAVANNWGDETFQQLFGLSRDEMRQELAQNGLNLIYSTATMSGNNISLPVATFNGTNLKTKTLGKKVSDWSAESFNIYDLTRRGYFGFTNPQGSHVDAWCVRYATGATLAKGSAETPTYNHYKKLPNCSDVKVYNRDVDHLSLSAEDLKRTPPRIASDAAESTYYRCGDVVRYMDRYYVCVSNHALNDKARFITLNDQGDHTTMTFPFGDEGNDVVYADEMASSEAAALWIGNILLDDDMCEELVQVMADCGASDYANQIVPENDAIREKLVKVLFRGYSVITDAYLPSPFEGGVRGPSLWWEYVKEAQFDSQGKVIPGTYDVLLCAPAFCLLVDQMRYQTHLVGSTDHWVPYLICQPDGSFYNNEFVKYMNEDPSQTSLAPDLFHWQDMGTFQRKGEKLAEIVKKPFHIAKIALYWKHRVDTILGGPMCMLFDFTKNLKEHPLEAIREEVSQVPGAWNVRNVTTREFAIIDDGRRKNQLFNVSVGRHQ